MPIRSASRAQLDGVKRELDEIEQSLGDPKLDEAALTKLRDRLEPLAQQLASFIASTAPKVDDLNQRVALLAPKNDGKAGTQDIPETPDSARLREQVTASRDAAVGLLAAANSLQVQAGQLATRIADRRRAVFTEKTFQQSPSIISPSMWETVLSTAPLLRRPAGAHAARLVARPSGRDGHAEDASSSCSPPSSLSSSPGRVGASSAAFIRKAEARRPSSELGVAIEARAPRRRGRGAAASRRDAVSRHDRRAQPRAATPASRFSRRFCSRRPGCSRREPSCTPCWLLVLRACGSSRRPKMGRRPCCAS